MTGAIKLIFFLLALPFCAGLVFVPRDRSLKRIFHIAYIYGWLLDMAVFFPVSVACVFFIEQNNFIYCVTVYAILQILLAIMGVAVFAGRRMRSGIKNSGSSEAARAVSQHSEKNEGVAPQHNDKADVPENTESSSPGGAGENEAMQLEASGMAKSDSQLEFKPRGSGKVFRVIQGFSLLLKEKGRRNFLEAVILWAIFGGLLAFQLYKAVTTVFFDGDNIYYVVQSLIATQQGTMYREMPYIGGSTELDMRHALAVMPMWFAYLSEVSGIHATMLCRTVMPLFLLPFVYLIWFAVGGELYGVMSLRDDYKKPASERAADVGFFMCALSMLAVFGSVSIYTSERFLMTRTWQGKAMFANIAVPLILLGVLWINRECGAVRNNSTDKKFSLSSLLFFNGWFLFLLVNILSGMCTSMGVAFTAALICTSCLVSAVRKRKPLLMLYGILVCIPNAMYMAAYMLLK